MQEKACAALGNMAGSTSNKVLLVQAGAHKRVMDAMRAHATQIEVDGPFFALSNNLGLQVWGHEYYTLVKGAKHEPFDGKGYETDLFAGIELS